MTLKNSLYTCYPFDFPLLLSLDILHLYFYLFAFLSFHFVGVAHIGKYETFGSYESDHLVVIV